jgi:hypothetical protein
LDGVFPKILAHYFARGLSACTERASSWTTFKKFDDGCATDPASRAAPAQKFDPRAD